VYGVLGSRSLDRLPYFSAGHAFSGALNQSLLDPADGFRWIGRHVGKVASAGSARKIACAEGAPKPITGHLADAWLRKQRSWPTEGQRS